MNRLLGWVVAGVLAGWPGAFAGPADTPADAAQLRALDARTRAAAKAVAPTVVAIRSKPRKDARSEIDGVLGSGVIVSADGFILSQYHVTHQQQSRPPTGPVENAPRRKAGDRLVVVLADDREVEAEVLGADRAHDLSLVRITTPGTWPHAEPADLSKLAPGAWVLKLGHPNGDAAGRPPVVRLGRALDVRPEIVAADCLISPGDSGGPLFDLDGRLVGVIQAGGGAGQLPALPPGATVRYAVSIAGYTRADVCEKLLPELKTGRVLDTRPAASAPGQVLPPEEWANGPTVLRAYREVVRTARASVVEVRCHGLAVALGTVVAKDGLVLTKASELTGPPVCRTAAGAELPAEVLGIDPAFDLALLKVAAELRPVDWADPTEPGGLTASPGPGEGPVAVGVVSGPVRTLPGPFPAAYRLGVRPVASPPEVIGSPVLNRGYWVEFVEENAADAGLRPGDVILTLAGRRVTTHEEFAQSVRGHFAGERIPARVRRGDRDLTLTVLLRLVQPNRLSQRDRVPVAFEHGTPLLAAECGGPVVNLDGRAVGVNIARHAESGSLAVPAAVVRQRLVELRSGKLAHHWKDVPPPKPAAAGPAPQPVRLSLDELKQKLQQRRDAIGSFYVEYELTGEPLADLNAVMVWRLPQVRDYTEEHRIGFAGPKRYARVMGAGFRPLLVPADRVVPDDRAPPADRSATDRDVRNARATRDDGRLSHLFRTADEDDLVVCDGTRWFRYSRLSRRFSEADPGSCGLPTPYLMGIGLAPAGPAAEAARYHGLPAYLDRDPGWAVELNTDAAGGVACVVLRGERREDRGGAKIDVRERWWLDPKRGFAVVRREITWGDGTWYRWENARFEEVAPGCWLPLASAATQSAPGWADPSAPAYRTRITVRRLQVYDVPVRLFEPTPPE